MYTDKDCLAKLEETMPDKEECFRIWNWLILVPGMKHALCCYMHRKGMFENPGWGNVAVFSDSGYITHVFDVVPYAD